GEEQAVDQLGLATGELADEGQGDVIGAEQALGALQLGRERIGVEPVVFEPASKAGAFAQQLALPGYVSVDLLTETLQAHSGSPRDHASCVRGYTNFVPKCRRWRANRDVRERVPGQAVGPDCQPVIAGHYAPWERGVNWPARHARLKVGQGCRAVSPGRSGRVRGLRMRTRFWRFSSPLSRLTWLLATPKAAARKAIRWAFALPSTGGAVRRIFSRSPCSPANSSR